MTIYRLDAIIYKNRIRQKIRITPKITFKTEPKKFLRAQDVGMNI